MGCGMLISALLPSNCMVLGHNLLDSFSQNGRGERRHLFYNKVIVRISCDHETPSTELSKCSIHGCRILLDLQDVMHFS